MEMETGKPEKGKNSIAVFFRQTFRHHGGGEYSELLTRGLQSENNGGLNKKYPWAYVRLFTLIFVLFAIFLLIIRFTSNELFVPMVTLLGALSFNLPFLLLLFELYPKKDLSFMFVLLAMLIGGAGSNVLAQILFNIFVPANRWMHAVYSGFFEELSKAAATVLIIVVARKNSPLIGFITGAAVGCGFSIAEDMGYIFMQANEMPFVNLTTVIELSLARGLSAVCTHTLWSAAIGWAFCRFKRHFANLAVYGVTLLSCGLHICWDLPLNNLAIGFIYAVCACVVLVECVLILHFGRKKVFKENIVNINDLYKNENMVRELWTQAEQESLAVSSLNKKDPQYWRYWGQFTLALGAFLMAVTGVLYCSIPFRETYGTVEFDDPESFVSFMQNGMEIEADGNRFYDEALGYSSYTEVDGVLVRVVQSETVGSVTYNYEYSVTYDPIGGKNHYFIAQAWITLDSNPGIPYHMVNVYNDGKLYASFFHLNSDVTGYNVSSDGEGVTAITYNPAFERDLSDWKYLSLFCTFAGIAGVATVCYISLVIKSWRVKKSCLTENASSAE